jgi:hypothetical protein
MAICAWHAEEKFWTSQSSLASLSNTILKVGTDATQRNLLACQFAMIREKVLSKSSIVGMILSNLDSMGGSIGFK